MRLLAPLSLAALVGCVAPDDDGSVSPPADDLTDGTDDVVDSGLDDDDDDEEEEEEDEDEDEEDDRPDLPMGYDDDHAQKACALVDDGGAEIIAASSMSEAGQIILLPSDDGEAFNIQLPESGPGFVTVEIGDWMTTVRFFADDLANYTIHGNDPEDLTGLRANGACPEERISDNRWAFHEWGSYVIEFSEDSPREIWFVAVKES